MTFANIFADFSNADYRRIGGFYARYPLAAHENLLVAWFGLAILFSKQHTVVPYSFLTECTILRSAIRRLSLCLQGRLIRFSTRDFDIERLASRRQDQYRPSAPSYPDMYTPGLAEEIAEMQVPLLRRKAQTGETIAKTWADRNDEHPHWRELLQTLNHNTIDRIRREPEIMLDRGHAVIWPHFQREFGLDSDQTRAIRDLLNSDMFLTYIDEYELRTLRNLPFTWRDLALGPQERVFDIDLFQALLGQHLFDVLFWLVPADMLWFRDTPTYFALMAEYLRLVTTLHGDPSRIAEASTIRRAGQPKVFGRLATVIPPLLPFTTRPSELRVTQRKALLGALEVVIERGVVRRARTISRRLVLQEDVDLAVFTALPLEAERLAASLNLTKRDVRRWHGQKDKCNILLFQATSMGRVAAAVATARVLQDFRPRLLIVAGIAGGFETEKIEQGFFIVPRSVVDMALRKLYEKEGTEFRPEVYNLHPALSDALQGPEFDEHQWSAQVVKEAEWPQGRRPAFSYDGLIASTDEVISDRAHIKLLIDAFPKLLGIEMEAGAVCAAARVYNVPVCVIRGVSDKADPSKKDDNWRTCVMKSIGHLLQRLDLNRLLP